MGMCGSGIRTRNVSNLPDLKICIFTLNFCVHLPEPVRGGTSLIGEHGRS